MIKYKYSFVSFILMLLLSSLANAQLAPQRVIIRKHKQYLDTFRTKTLYKTTYVAAPFILSGVVLYNTPGKKFQNLRNEFIPNYSTDFDEYLQYSSTLMLYGIKIGGVKGKSSWGKLLATHAISTVTMAALTNGVKYSVREPRPDASNNESYPSGHTALAFMSANMVHHEYGLTKSPWYSVGAYSLATLTAISRVLNNKHYIHDVMLGAGIGILSTEIGYLLSDIIFKEKGVLMANREFGSLDIDKPTSYFGLVIGFNKILNKIPITSSTSLRSSWGTTSGLEGVCYFDKNWGIGANASVYNAETSNVRGRFVIKGPALSWYNIGAGLHYSSPVSSSCRIGGKILVGYSGLMERSFNGYTIDSSRGVNVGAGIFVDRYITQGMLIKLYTNLEQSYFENSQFNLLNIVTGASVNIDLGI